VNPCSLPTNSLIWSLTTIAQIGRYGQCDPGDSVLKWCDFT